MPPAPAGDLFEDNADEVDDTSPDLATDSDGWVYGDNKWENQSSKGGMSKAVHEIVEPLHEHKPGDARDESTDSLGSAIVDTDKVNPNTIATGQEFSPLRQRLINTLKQPGSNGKDED
ncbi:hypothetical protein F5887DRAFT_915216 [Amanita rubescens]|nr:hypothetical protein F5887DRAFT_915216 [Amanita rubescens]